MNTAFVAPSTFSPRWTPALRFGTGEYFCNSGGPHSRTRQERIRSTVLGDDDGPIRCPKVLRVGINFGASPPLATARRWLEEAGFADEEEARAALSLPPMPCLCMPDSAPEPPAAAKLTPLEGLSLAIVLGLATPQFYDPRRPVLWTQASLTRRLLLFDGGGFYA